jgi:hypothetical protein
VLTVRRILLVLTASLVLAGAFGSVVGTSPVGAVAHRGAPPSARSAPVEPRLCTIGQRCAPSVPGNVTGPVSVPTTLVVRGAWVVIAALVRHRRPVERRQTYSQDFTPGIFRPPIASLA